MTPSLTRAEAAALEAQSAREAGHGVCGHGPLCTREKCRAYPRTVKVTRKEGEIVREILRFLQTVRGVVAWRQNSGGAMLPGRDGKPQHVRFGVKGCADIIGWWTRLAVAGTAKSTGTDGAIRVALFLAIEVKRPGQYPTVEQQAFLDAVKNAGGVAIVARSVDDVRRALLPVGGAR